MQQPWLIVWHHVLKWIIQIPEDQESLQVTITPKDLLQYLENSWVRLSTPEKLTREKLTTNVESPMLKMNAWVNRLISSHNDSSQSSKQWTSAAYEMDGSESIKWKSFPPTNSSKVQMTRTLVIATDSNNCIKKESSKMADSRVLLLTRKRGCVILDKQLLIFYIFLGVGVGRC